MAFELQFLGAAGTVTGQSRTDQHNSFNPQTMSSL